MGPGAGASLTVVEGGGWSWRVRLQRGIRRYRVMLGPWRVVWPWRWLHHPGPVGICHTRRHGRSSHLLRGLRRRGRPSSKDVADPFHRPAVRGIGGHRRLEHRGQPPGVRQARRVVVDDLVQRAELVVGDHVWRVAGSAWSRVARATSVTGIGRLAARRTTGARYDGEPMTSPVWLIEASATDGRRRSQ